MKCVERRSLREIEETCGDELRRQRIPKQERRKHLNSSADSHQKTIRHDTNV